MAAPRFFVPEPLDRACVGTTIELPSAVAHHATRVLRHGVGAALTLFDGTGGEYAVELVAVDKRGASVRVDAFDPVERESPLAVTLAQAVVANDAMDYALRKATELGVTAIQPVIAARSAALPSGDRADRRRAHWQQIAVAACEQCGRNRVPEVCAPLSLSNWLAGWPHGGVLFEPTATMTLPALEKPPSAVLIGPEGGFTTAEIEAAARGGFSAVRIGPRVLRTETAGLAALAAMGVLWGDWRD